MEFKDYYKTLNISRDAKEEDIKRAYRKLARKYHPDVSKESNAEEKFKNVQEAYEVLKDAKKRAAYDQLGSHWKSGQEFRPPPNWQGFSQGGSPFEDVSDFSDFFNSIFGDQVHTHRTSSRRYPSSQRGQDERAKVSISLEDAYHGGTKMIQLQVPVADNRGRVSHQSRTLKMTIPAGITSGQQLRLAKQGSPGMGNGQPGDLYLEIEIEPHRLFTLQERDVSLTLPITPWEAVLGAKIKVPTLGGHVELKIAPGSQAGQKLRLKGRGLSTASTKGDQYIVLKIIVPPVTSENERALYEKMAKEIHFNPRENL